MKKTTCRDLKGACDLEIVGNTADEMSQNCKNHVMEMLQSGDAAHKTAMEQMMQLSQEDQQKWYEDFKNNFDSLPDA